MCNVGQIFGRSYIRAAVPNIAINGFKTSGICPINSKIFSEEQFSPSFTTDIEIVTSEATSFQSINCDERQHDSNDYTENIINESELDVNSSPKIKTKNKCKRTEGKKVNRNSIS